MSTLYKENALMLLFNPFNDKKNTFINHFEDKDDLSYLTRYFILTECSRK